MPEDKPNEEARLNSPAAPADQPPERTRRRWPWVVIVLAVVAGIGLLVYRHLRTPPAIPHAPLPVEIALTKVQKGAIPVYVNGLGTVTPLATVTVLSRVDGQIMKVNYTEGQIVPEGFALLQIDPRPYAAQLTTAQGQLERDRETLAEAKINQERYRGAYEQKAIPKQQFDDQASLVRQLEGTVKFDEGQVASAQTQVDYCTITAPVAGLVGLRLVDVGNIVHAAGTTGLVVLTQIQPITVIFSVAEDNLPAIQEQLRQGHVLPVEAWDREKKKKLETGTLAALDSQIDTTTGTIRLKAQFDNKDDALFPNQFVNARLVVNTLSDVTLVPDGTIQRGANVAFVYVVKPDNTLEMRPVKVGITEGGMTLVTGVEPDETIAADNFNRLQEGMAVTERTASSAATPATTNAPETPRGQKP
jgi:multidrug efflux system membrane fusion protein